MNVLQWGLPSPAGHGRGWLGTGAGLCGATPPGLCPCGTRWVWGSCGGQAGCSSGKGNGAQRERGAAARLAIPLGLGSVLVSPQHGWPFVPPSPWVHSLSPCCGRKSQVLPLPALLGMWKCTCSWWLSVEQWLVLSSASRGWAVPCPASLRLPRLWHPRLGGGPTGLGLLVRAAASSEPGRDQAGGSLCPNKPWSELESAVGATDPALGGTTGRGWGTLHSGALSWWGWSPGCCIGVRDGEVLQLLSVGSGAGPYLHSALPRQAGGSAMAPLGL